MTIPNEFQISDENMRNNSKELTEVTQKILDLAKGKTGDKEDTWYDFKLKYETGAKSNDEIRKDFAAMANSGGGYILLGVSDDLSVIGLNGSFDESRFHQVLMDSTKISFHPRWNHGSVDYNGKTIFLVKIAGTIPTNPVWVVIGDRKGFPMRYGSHTNFMADSYYFAILQKETIQLPENFRLDPADTGLYSVVDYAKVGDCVDWALDMDIYQKLRAPNDYTGTEIYPYERIIPIPFSNPRVFSVVRYGRDEYWGGSFESLKEIIPDIEKGFRDQYGIGNSFWTIPIGRDKKKLAFRTGVSAKELVRNLLSTLKDQKYGSFAWSVSSGFVFALVIGEKSEDYVSLHLNFEMTAIPNGTPILHFSNNTIQPILAPLYENPTRKIGVIQYRPAQHELWVDSPPDSLLEPEAHGNIEALLGGKRKINQTSLFPMGNLAIVHLVSNESRIQEWPLSCFEPMIIDISSYGSYTDSSKEISLLSCEMTWDVYRSIGRTEVILLFNARVGVNQASNLKRSPR